MGLLVTTLQQIESHLTIQVYGPEGLGKLVRESLKLTFCKLNARFIIHELVPFGFIVSKVELHHDEVLGSFIEPVNGIWHISDDELCIIKAAPIKHTVPCVGYVLQEPPQPGPLLMDKLRPILNHYAEEFALLGQNPIHELAKFKEGHPLILPDQRILHPKDFMGPSKVGRKIVILGDTCDPSSMVEIAMNADVLIHEATNAFLSEDKDHGSLEIIQKQTMKHGHSLPQMAGAFAKRIKAKRLFLNHFSNRYRGDSSPESIAIMHEIRDQAIQEFGNDQVVCAYDFYEYTLNK